MQATRKEIVAIVLCLAIVGASVAVLAFPLLDSIPFETIEQGTSCGFLSRVEYIITDEQDWETLWIDVHNRSTSDPDLTPVNFTTDLIIAVFQGQRATGGFRTTINRIAFNGTHYVVHVNERHPAPGEIVTMALTQPFHIVKVSGHLQEFPVEFVYNVFNGF